MLNIQFKIKFGRFMACNISSWAEKQRLESESQLRLNNQSNQKEGTANATERIDENWAQQINVTFVDWVLRPGMSQCHSATIR